MKKKIDHALAQNIHDRLCEFFELNQYPTPEVMLAMSELIRKVFLKGNAPPEKFEEWLEIQRTTYKEQWEIKTPRS